MAKNSKPKSEADKINVSPTEIKATYKQIVKGLNFNFPLVEEQKKVPESFYKYDFTFVHGDAGCLSLGTKVLMYDGSFKNVEDIIVGDKLMGVDSTPRNVLELKRGREQMYWVRQKKSKDYRVNENHVLSLIYKNSAKYPRKIIDGKSLYQYDQKPITDKREEVLNIKVKDFLELSKTKQERLLFGYKTNFIDFKKEDVLEIDPYYLGLWLADGSKRNIRQITNTDSEIINYLNSLGGYWNGINFICNSQLGDEMKESFKLIYSLENCNSLSEKYIPKKYLTSSKENRDLLLSGLIDGDGYYCENGKYFEITQKSERLSDDICFLCNSLGYKVNKRPKIAKMVREDGSTYSCVVYRIRIFLDTILPVKIERKKNKLRVIDRDFRLNRIKIEKHIVDDYYGFTLDGDNLFILEDFTVTHNSGKTLSAVHTALTYLAKGECKEIWITRPMLKNNLAALPGAQPYYSKILTPNGWTTMGEIKEGDIVFAYDGTLSNVLGVYEHGTRNVYEITMSDGSKAVACDKHLWEIKERNKDRSYGKPKLVNTEYLITHFLDDNGKSRIILPKNEPIEFGEKTYNIHPYVLGCLLGDGSLSNSISISNIDLDLIERFEKYLPNGVELSKPCGIVYNIKGTTSGANKLSKKIKVTNIETEQFEVFERIGIASIKLGIDKTTLNGRCLRNSIIDGYKYEFIENTQKFTNIIKEYISDLGLLHKDCYEKFIPEEYLFGSIEQRKELLKGLIDTDGNVSKDGTVYYTTVSKLLCDDIVSLVKSLGGTARIFENEPKTSHIDNRIFKGTVTTYNIRISFEHPIEITTVGRKKERLKQHTSKIHKNRIVDIRFVGEEEVKCIMIDHPKQLYITDDYIVTHNTLEEKMHPYTFPIIQNIEACVGKETCAKLLESQIIRIMPIEVAKGCTFMDSAVIVDEYQDMDYDDFRTILSRLGDNSKMILCGSKQQISKLIRLDSAIYRTMCLENEPSVGYITLKSNHRAKSLAKLLPLLDKSNDEISEKQMVEKRILKQSTIIQG